MSLRCTEACVVDCAAFLAASAAAVAPFASVSAVCAAAATSSTRRVRAAKEPASALDCASAVATWLASAASVRGGPCSACSIRSSRDEISGETLACGGGKDAALCGAAAGDVTAVPGGTRPANQNAAATAAAQTAPATIPTT